MKRFLLCVMILLCGCSSSLVQKEDILTHAISSQHISEDWNVVQAQKDDFVVLLFYNDDYSRHEHSIYKKQGQGYTCVSSGYLLENSEMVLDYVYDDYHIYSSLNKKEINGYELYNHCDISKGAIDSNKPFILILPMDSGDITFYTGEEAVLPVE